MPRRISTKFTFNALSSTQSRREFLRTSVLGSGALLVGLDQLTGITAAQDHARDPFADGQQIGIVEFTNESRAPLDTVLGTGLDARLYSDLSSVTQDHLVTPTEKFYVRTTASELLDISKPWAIHLGGLVQQSATLLVADLQKTAKPMGLHLMECSGNTRATRFALLSVADWTGVPLTDVLAARVKSPTTRVMVSGFDEYPGKSATSVPGADWVFTLEQLDASKAFLALGMNGQPLTKDHGAPVRLVVAGWYGCTCIKWVNAVTFVDENAAATSQMREFAARTHQHGAPELARDYRPAVIDQAAMPIRVEKWSVAGKIKYRVVGILWGGSRRIKSLEIRFNPEEDYVPVDQFSQTKNDPWSVWSHAWSPKARGGYLIRLRIGDPGIETKRLDSGHYVRSVEITEV